MQRLLLRGVRRLMTHNHFKNYVVGSEVSKRCTPAREREREPERERERERERARERERERARETESQGERERQRETERERDREREAYMGARQRPKVAGHQLIDTKPGTYPL